MENVRNMIHGLLIFFAGLCISVFPSYGTSLFYDSETAILPHLYYCADNVYQYGRSLPAPYWVTRRDANHTTFNGFDVRGIVATYSVVRVFTTHTDSTILVNVKDTDTSQYFLFKSIDGGAHFGNNAPAYNDSDYVLALGYSADADSQITDVSLLQNGSIVDAEIGTGHVLFLGEYNINNDRTAGSTNDQVRIMKSTDNGDTWSEVIHWNTDGSTNNVRHVHIIQQDPWTKDIYFGTGDADDQSGVWRYNGTSNISALSNHEPSWYVSNSTYADDGLAVGSVTTGSQKARPGDIDFTENYIYWTADATAAASEGIWRGAKDLSSRARVDSTLMFNHGMETFSILKTSSGNYIATSFVDSVIKGADSQMRVLISEDCETWRICGSVGIRANTSATFFPMHEFAGRIWLPSTYYSVNFYNVGGTVPLLESAASTGDSTTLLTPTKMTWYIDAANGNNANRGNHPDEAWRTLGRATSYSYMDAGDDIVLKTNAIHSAADSGLVVQGSGTEAARYTYRSDKPGTKAVIECERVLTGWATYAPTAGCWYATYSAPSDSAAYVVWFDGVLGIRTPADGITKAQLNSARRWQAFAGAGALPDTVIAYFGASMTATRMTASVNNGVNSNEKNYIDFQDLYVKHGSGQSTSTNSGGFYLNGGYRLRLYRCRADSSTWWGFSVNGSDSSRIESCIAYNNYSSSGLWIRSTAEYDTIYNSTFVGGFTFTTACLVDSTPAYPVMVNNIFAQNAAAYAVQFKKKKVQVVDYAGDYNMFYSAQANFGTYGYGNGTAIGTIGAWKTATGVDKHSLENNPLFRDVTDSSLRKMSPGVGAGTNINGRMKPVSIGAVEFKNGVDAYNLRVKPKPYDYR